VSAVHFAAAVEGDHAFDGDRAAAAIDVQRRPVQRVQAEAAPDLVVTDEQLIDIPPRLLSTHLTTVPILQGSRLAGSSKHRDYTHL
jgi:hypothetical protein